MLEFDAAAHGQYRGLGYSLEALVEAHADATVIVDGLVKPLAGRLVSIDADRHMLIDQTDAGGGGALVVVPLARVISVRARYALRSTAGDDA